MRIISCLAILMCVACVIPARGQDPQKPGEGQVFTVKGLFSVEVPPNGFAWSQLQTLEANGTKISFFVCTNEGETARAVLTVEQRLAEDDQTRITVLKAHYNGLMQSLKGGGFKDIKGTKPNFMPPINGRNSFSLTARNAQDTETFVRSVTVFGKNIYRFQLMSESEDGVEQLAKVTESLQELKSDQGERFVVGGHFSVNVPPNGFQWSKGKSIEVGTQKIDLYACMSATDGASAMLTVDPRSAQDDKTRIATLNAHYNDTIRLLKGGRFTDVQGTKPDFKPPIKGPNVLSFTAKTSEGAETFIRVVTVFGRNIYQFQIMSQSENGAEQLVKAAESLQELNPELGTKDTDKSKSTAQTTPKEAPETVEKNGRKLQNYPIKIEIPKIAERVTKDTTLEVGMTLGCSWANKWHDVVVVGLNDDGTVKIHWKKYDATWDGDISRDCLIIHKKILEKQKKSTGDEPEKTASSKPSKTTAKKSLAVARKGVKTKLTKNEQTKKPVPEPPADLFNIVKYPSALGDLAAYLTPDPGDGKKHPAMIWITGGDCNTIGDVWSEAPPENDQTAGAYRNAGLVMMFPSLRGGNQNPGFKEAFFGEVDDVIAAADFLAKQDYIDPERIYLGGHSSGGTLVLLVAEYSDRFRAVFSFGPAEDVTGYDDEFQVFQKTKTEVSLRSPLHWLDSIKSPTFVLEANNGNIMSLLKMANSTDNPQVVFRATGGANHFSILAPVNELIAKKLLKDTEPKCNVQISIEEVQGLFKKK